MSKVDLYQLFTNFSSVKKISNLYPIEEDQTLDFIFYVCPRMTGKGLFINRNKTGFTAKYQNGISKYSQSRFEMVKRFIINMESQKIPYSLTTIFASADSFLLFPAPVNQPQLPEEDIPEGFQLVSNYEIYQKYLLNFGIFYNEQIWNKLPRSFVNIETKRLMEILPSSAPENLKIDFIERCFAGFALDGFILKQKEFGQNPIILGVESSGVSVIQNATFEQLERIPIIELI